MPNPLLPITGALIGVSTGTMISESILMSPKTIILFYGGIAKACYKSTGSKRAACGLAALTCAAAVLPGPQQGAFIIACAAVARGANKL